MKLTLIGAGYVGLVTGTRFAEVGHQVVCVDNDAAKIKLLQSGGLLIYEPCLEELVKKNVAAGRLAFTTSTTEGVQKSDAIVIATEWDEFKKLDLERARQSLTHPIMFDGRNLFDPADMERLGWIYQSVGR